MTAEGFSQTYGADGFHHIVVIKGLLPFTTYYYSCGDATDGFSPVNTFITARAAGDTTPFTINIIGDMGISNSENTIAALNATSESTEFLWHIGDISYADDRIELNYESTWNSYMNSVQPFVSKKGYMTLPGNHEATCSEALPFLCTEKHRNFTAYRYRFRMPYEESGAINNMWYSFDYGQVHFISFSSETDFPGAPEGPGTYLNGGPFGDQLAWLEADLQKAVANRKNVPWIFAAAHRPVYSSNGYSQAVTDAFEPLLTKYGVDMYFAGHVHWYERLWPMKNAATVQKNYINPTVPVYIINGCAGNTEGHTTSSNNPDWMAVVNSADYGYGQLTVVNATVAEWKWYKAATRELGDSITLVKDSHLF